MLNSLLAKTIVNLNPENNRIYNRSNNNDDNDGDSHSESDDSYEENDSREWEWMSQWCEIHGLLRLIVIIWFAFECFRSTSVVIVHHSKIRQIFNL